jgi:amino acid permease
MNPLPTAHPLTYIKTVLAVVGATVMPPIAAWLVTYIPAPDNVRTAFSTLLIALITGGAVYSAPNAPRPAPGP